MARELRGILLALLLLALPGLAQDYPVEVKVRSPSACPGCDCPADYCYSPVCDCTLPVTETWLKGMLARIQGVLALAYPDHMADPVEVRLQGLSRLELGTTGGEPNFGLYGDGLIRVSNEVSRREAVVILAHEYAHAWQYHNHPDPDHVQGPLVEGFAEWIAYQVLKRLGDYPGADRIKTNIDPVYGGGFRWYLDCEREHGLPVVWEMATSWLDLKGNRVAAQPSGGPPMVPEAPPEPTPTPAPTNTGGFWMARPKEAKHGI